MKTTSKEVVVTHPPCKMACPISTNAREYIQLIAERRYQDALASIKVQNPLPRVCGRICVHPCETACKRGLVEEPVSIAALKQFASDGPWREKEARPVTSGASSRSGPRVAVVGSGPAGLAAAKDLALLGYGVTIFEALAVAGGMPQVGVPEYRLPKSVLAQEVGDIVALGVEIRTNIKVGQGITLEAIFEEGFSAVFLGIGAHLDRPLDIPGENLDGVWSAVSFLRAVSEKGETGLGRKVAVVGGGNTAVDSARSALRLGAQEVHMLYRRSREEMPAANEEIEAATLEGVKIAYLTSPVEVLSDSAMPGRVVGLKCIKNELAAPDASGRRKPVIVSGTEFVLDVDTVIVAVGQIPETSWMDGKLTLGKRDRLIVVDDRTTLKTSTEAIFAGGDAVTGPATVIQAIAAGKRAAIAIDAYLTKKPLDKTAVIPEARVERPEVRPGILKKTTKFSRSHRPSLDADQCVNSFQEVESVFSEKAAVDEALRCLHCQLGARIDQARCVSCLNCVRVCPVNVPVVSKMGEVNIDPVACQACGVCALECPVQAIEIDLDSRRQVSDKIKRAVAQSKSAEPAIVGIFDLHGNFTSDHLALLCKDFPGLIPITVFGVRRIGVGHVLAAFESGAAAVLAAPCIPSRDPYPDSTLRTKRRLNQIGGLLDRLGVGNGRFAVMDMPEEGLVDKDAVTAFIESVRALNPSPARLPS